ncbi:unnamed protein product, partial [Prorocentrum cordatum]
RRGAGARGAAGKVPAPPGAPPRQQPRAAHPAGPPGAPRRARVPRHAVAVGPPPGRLRQPG